MNVKINSTGGLSVGDSTNGYKDLATKEYVDNKTFTVSWNDVSGKPTTFTPASHNHSAGDINSGTLDLARIPTGTTSSTVALGNHTHSQISGYDIGLSANPNSQVPAFDIVGNESGELLNIGASNPINTDYLSLDANGLYIIDRATEDNWVYFARDGIHIVPSWNNDEDYVLAFPQITANKTIATTDHTHTNFVDLTSDQTISGTKQFLPDKLIIDDTVQTGWWTKLANGSIVFYDHGSATDENTRIDKNAVRTYNGTTVSATCWWPRVDGHIVVDNQVDTAIGTINTNFTNIATMISTKPTDSVLTASVGSRASGWTFSSDGSTADNKVKIYHWGQMGVVMGSARKSSAISANTAESSLGTISMPSGYSILAAFVGSAGTGEIWAVNSSGVFSIRHFTGKNANTWIGFRIVVMLNNIGDRYSRTNVATI